MKHINLFRALLLLAALVLGLAGAFAQIPIRQDIQGYRGNIVQSDTIRVSPADTLAGLTVRAQGNSSPASSNLTPQPTIVRKGLAVVVRFATSLTLPDLGYYRLMAGGQTIVYGDVRVSTQGIITPGIANTVLLSLLSRIGVLESGKLNSATFSAFQSSQTTRDAGQDTQINTKLAISTYANFTTTQTSKDASQDATIGANATTATAHFNNTNNPHGVTKTQLGLGSVDNTSDANKPVSTAQQAALDLKANQAATYTKTETNNLIGNKADFQRVDSFAQAKANVTTGTPKTFFIANNESFGGTTQNPTPTNSNYDGTNWNHSPALTQNN